MILQSIRNYSPNHTASQGGEVSLPQKHLVHFQIINIVQSRL